MTSFSRKADFDGNEIILDMVYAILSSSKDYFFRCFYKITEVYPLGELIENDIISINAPGYFSNN
jgi:hypothetical protein